MEQLEFPRSVYPAALLQGIPEPRLRPFYTVPEIVRYADTTARTARGWLRGYGDSRPPVGAPDRAAELLTFADLVEVAAIAAARKVPIPLQTLRRAIDEARRIYAWERPLLVKRFEHDGRQFFVDDEAVGGKVNLNRAGQIAWSHISAVLKTLDYEEELAIRWWPAGRDVPIAVDPRYSMGRPFIERMGVSTVVLYDRFQAGATCCGAAGVPVNGSSVAKQQ